MITESTVEWYRFTCPRCQAQWVAHYEVGRFTDDAGQSRSFYRCHGLPCQAPARAESACPVCGHAPVRAELPDTSGRTRTPAADTLPEPPAPPLPGPAAADRRQRPMTVWRQFKFKAVISLDPAARLPAADHSAETHSIMVHASRPDQPGSDRYFPAVIARDDEQPLSPGDSRVAVTISVPDDEASEFFSPGRPFSLWTGTDIGHGTVLLHVFFS
jgi:hypothetical protein